MAAVLACGEGALLSHGSAAALWRLTRPRKGDVDLTVTGEGGRGRRDGLSIHRSRTLREEDRVIRDSIPVTSPRRTIIDLAASGMSGRPLERILTEAEYRRLLDPSAFDAGFHPGGCRVPPALRAVLQAYEPGSAPTRSELEERFLTLCRERRLPQPVVNAEVLGLIVDFLWPSAGLVVEVDGRLGHATAQGFQDDRDGDGLLVAAGFSVLRFTWRDVTERPAVVGHRVGRLLGSP
jgi:very-short-patch-repair endonuclease